MSTCSNIPNFSRENSNFTNTALGFTKGQLSFINNKYVQQLNTNNMREQEPFKTLMQNLNTHTSDLLASNIMQSTIVGGTVSLPYDVIEQNVEYCRGIITHIKSTIKALNEKISSYTSSPMPQLEQSASAPTTQSIDYHSCINHLLRLAKSLGYSEEINHLNSLLSESNPDFIKQGISNSIENIHQYFVDNLDGYLPPERLEMLRSDNGIEYCALDAMDSIERPELEQKIIRYTTECIRFINTQSIAVRLLVVRLIKHYSSILKDDSLLGLLQETKPDANTDNNNQDVSTDSPNPISFISDDARIQKIQRFLISLANRVLVNPDARTTSQIQEMISKLHNPSRNDYLTVVQDVETFADTLILNIHIERILTEFKELAVKTKDEHMVLRITQLMASKNTNSESKTRVLLQYLEKYSTKFWNDINVIILNRIPNSIDSKYTIFAERFGNITTITNSQPIDYLELSVQISNSIKILNSVASSKVYKTMHLIAFFRSMALDMDLFDLVSSMEKVNTDKYTNVVTEVNKAVGQILLSSCESLKKIATSWKKHLSQESAEDIKALTDKTAKLRKDLVLGQSNQGTSMELVEDSLTDFLKKKKQCEKKCLLDWIYGMAKSIGAVSKSSKDIPYDNIQDEFGNILSIVYAKLESACNYKFNPLPPDISAILDEFGARTRDLKEKVQSNEFLTNYELIRSNIEALITEEQQFFKQNQLPHKERKVKPQRGKLKIPIKGIITGGVAIALSSTIGVTSYYFSKNPERIPFRNHPETIQDSSTSAHSNNVLAANTATTAENGSNKTADTSINSNMVGYETAMQINSCVNAIKSNPELIETSLGQISNILNNMLSPAALISFEDYDDEVQEKIREDLVVLAKKYPVRLVVVGDTAGTLQELVEWLFGIQLGAKVPQ